MDAQVVVCVQQHVQAIPYAYTDVGTSTQGLLGFGGHLTFQIQMRRMILLMGLESLTRLRNAAYYYPC